jgi:predicted ABC-type ATPase
VSAVTTETALPEFSDPVPWLWLIAGPNGSGKSTFVENGVIESISRQAVEKINPDHITKQLLANHSELSLTEANYRAASEVERIVDHYIETGTSFAVETVLSTDKYKSRVEDAKARGYRVALIFVVLATPEDSLARIRTRVQLGGHDVPAEKVISRWKRSLKNLAWFACRADCVFVFDNTLPGSMGEPLLLASKEPGNPLVILLPDHHAEVTQELLSVEGVILEQTA